MARARSDGAPTSDARYAEFSATQRAHQLLRASRTFYLHQHGQGMGL